MNNWIDDHFKKREMILDAMYRNLEIREKILNLSFSKKREKENIFSKILNFVKLKNDEKY